MSRQLPPNPHMDVVKKEAKQLLHALQAGDEAAWNRCKNHHPRLFEHRNSKVPIPSLAAAQLIIAREYGFKSWVKLRAAVMNVRQGSDDPNRECSFCGLSSQQVKRLIAGPDVHICNNCVSKAIAHILHDTETSHHYTVAASKSICCSFCHQDMNGEDRGMIFSSQQANICGLCMKMCIDILSDDWAKDKPRKVFTL